MYLCSEQSLAVAARGQRQCPGRNSAESIHSRLLGSWGRSARLVQGDLGGGPHSIRCPPAGLRPRQCHSNHLFSQCWTSSHPVGRCVLKNEEQHGGDFSVPEPGRWGACK